MDPVMIVGAGPVGLTAAAELARYGVAVRIIDRSPHATETSKALAVQSRTLELMDRMGCADAFLAAGLKAHGTTFRSGGKVLARFEFSDVAGPYGFALMVPQRDTERLLTSHLAGLGVPVEREVELEGFTDEADGVVARLRGKNGVETVRTPWLLGCDGAHSTVRKALGVEFEGSTNDDDWLLADVQVEGEGAPPGDELSIYLHPDGPFVLIPMPGGRARLIGTRGRTVPGRRRPEPALEEVQAMADKRAGGFRVFDPVWLANFNINERKVRDYRAGHVFLAGDAAHIHSPAGGQGMNTGMQDAINLAWKLAMVIAGVAGPGLLDSYSTERSAVGDTVVRNASRLTDVATLANPVARAARNVMFRALFGLHAVQEAVATTMSETGIAYPDSPLSHGRGGGQRLAPDAYDGPPPGSGRAPRFVLQAADGAAGAELTGRYAGLLEAEVRRPSDPGRTLVVRPDGYVGLSAAAGAWGEVEDYLRGLSAKPEAAPPAAG